MATRQPEAQKIIINAGFGDFLNALWVEQRDRQALLALTELWWDTTNTFHFSFGEMTLTPTDFTVITGLRLGGRRLSYYENAHGDPHYLLEQLGTMVPVQRGGVRRTWLKNHFGDQREEDEADPSCLARAFMLYMLSSIFFASSGDVAPLGHLACMEDVWEMGDYNWGNAALAVLYRSMSDRSRGVSTNHCGMSFIWEVNQPTSFLFNTCTEYT